MGPDLNPADAAADPLIGTQLGNFRIEEQIAQGGMGRIYRAVHGVIGRRAAIKVLAEKYSRDRNMIKRLHREAQAVNRIGHPNIIDIFDFGQTPDQREYFVMEYLPGKNLAEILEREPRLPWALTEQVLAQLLNALAAAHDLGIVHRDIKPENILIVPQVGERVLVKVLDFGIAKSLSLGPEGEQLTSAGSVMGTPEYISPEQIRGRKIDGRADLYAVGVLLFEMVMGRRPFESEKVVSLLMAHLRESLPAMKNIPHELEVPFIVPSVVKKATAKDPEDRYADAREFARALGLEPAKITADRATHALPVSHWEVGTEPAEPAVTAHARATAPRAPIPAISRATAPGAVLPTETSPSPVPRGRRLLWVAPLVILSISAVVIGARLALRSRERPTTTRTAESKVPAPKPRPFPAVDDQEALLTHVRRTLRRGMQAGKASIRRASVRGAARLRDADARALLVSTLREDPERSVRAAAAAALAELGDPTVAQVLHSVRGQSSELMRVSIDEALLRVGAEAGHEGLVQALEAQSEATRLSAALALGDSGDARAKPVLIAAVSRPDAIEQPAFVAVLGMAARLGHAKARETLVSGTKREGRPSLRLACAEALAKLGDDAPVEVLEQLLRDGDQSTRLVAARVLASLGNYTGLEVLTEAVRARGKKLRILAALGLGAVADHSAMPPLAFLLSDSDLEVQVAAAEALANILALMPNRLIRRSQDWVFAALERGNWAMRHAAVGVTAEMDPELAIELLGWALRDQDERVRLAAVTRLGTMKKKSKRAVKILTVALADSSSEVRARAASALGEVGGEQAKQALVTAVRDQDTRVGIAAAGQLLALGDTRHLGDLRRAARQPNAELRAAAIRALGQWRDPKADPLLVAALRDRAQQVRFAAAVALAKRGDKRPVAELERVAGQPGPQRIEATRALARIGPAPREALAALAASEQVEERREAMGMAELFAPDAALPVLRRGSTDHDAGVRRRAASGLSRLLDSAQSSPRQRQKARRVLRRLRSDADPAVRAAASLGLALARPRVGTLDEPTVEPVDPAPLPEKVQQPLKPPPKKNDKPLFVDDSFKQRIYKLQISKASLALRSGDHQRALRHLARARRAQDAPTVLYEYGFVHLSWATKLRGSAARAHLLKARGYYGQYLRRAPRGFLAKKARAGLRDVKRLLKTLAR